jgi:UDP-N-acetylglucosamine 4-epimerase
LKTIGLRYFNVFGPRQDPQGAYAAVVPRWLAAMVAGAPVHIDEHRDLVYNVAVGERTSLNALFEALAAELAAAGRGYEGRPVHRDFRAGDVRHSLASIDRARERLGYAPTHTVKAGLREAMPWYLGFAGAQMASNAAAAGSDGR